MTLVEIAHQGRLGDFEINPLRNHAAVFDNGDDLQDRFGGADVAHRKIERDPDVVGPSPRVGERLAQQDPSESADVVGTFGDRYEDVWRNAAEFWAVPARQRFEGDDLAAH